MKRLFVLKTRVRSAGYVTMFVRSLTALLTWGAMTSLATIAMLGAAHSSSSSQLAGATISLHAAPPIGRALLQESLRLEDDDALLFLSIELEDGWKTYWRIPGRFGLSPRFDWSQSANLSDVQVHFPHPVLFTEADGLSIGYDEPTLWPIVVRKHDTAQPFILQLRLDLGLCETLCLPETVHLRWTEGARSPAGPLGELPFEVLFDLSQQMEVEPSSLGELDLTQADGRLHVTVPSEVSEAKLAVVEAEAIEHQANEARTHVAVFNIVGTRRLDSVWPSGFTLSRITFLSLNPASSVAGVFTKTADE